MNRTSMNIFNKSSKKCNVKSVIYWKGRVRSPFSRISHKEVLYQLGSTEARTGLARSSAGHGI
jgi:hypothetical protein